MNPLQVYYNIVVQKFKNRYFFLLVRYFFFSATDIFHRPLFLWTLPSLPFIIVRQLQRELVNASSTWLSVFAQNHLFRRYVIFRLLLAYQRNGLFIFQGYIASIRAKQYAGDLFLYNLLFSLEIVVPRRIINIRDYIIPYSIRQFLPYFPAPELSSIDQ